MIIPLITPEVMDMVPAFREYAPAWLVVSFWGNALTTVFIFYILATISNPSAIETDWQDIRLIDRFKMMKLVNLPWYYVWPMLTLGGWSAMKAVQVFFYRIDTVDWQNSITELIIGLVFAGKWSFFRWGGGRSYTPEQLHSLTVRFIVTALLTLIIFIGLGFRLSLRRMNDLDEQNIRLRKEELAAEAKARKDTTGLSRLNRKVGEIDKTTIRTDKTINKMERRQTEKEGVVYPLKTH